MLRNHEVGLKPLPLSRLVRCKAAAATRRGAPQDKAALQQALSAATSAASVLQLLEGGVGAFDAIHSATAIHRLALFADEPTKVSLASDPRVSNLVSRLSGFVDALDAQGLANVLWALARLDYGDDPRWRTTVSALLASLLRAASLHVVWEGARAQAVANAAWSVSRLGGGGGSLDTAEECRVVLEVLSGTGPISVMRPVELASYVWAYGAARLLPSSPGWADAVLTAFESQLQNLDAKELSMVLWAVASLQMEADVGLVNRAGERLALLVPTCEAQTLSNGLLALAKLGCTSADSVATLVQHSAALCSRDGVEPQALANVLWATASLNHDPGAEVVSKLVSRTIALSSRLNAADLTQTATAVRVWRSVPSALSSHTLAQLCRLDYAPGAATTRAFRAAFEAKRSTFNAYELKVVLRALAGWEQA